MYLEGGCVRTVLCTVSINCVVTNNTPSYIERWWHCEYKSRIHSWRISTSPPVRMKLQPILDLSPFVI
jgi:hypothetical protein